MAVIAAFVTTMAIGGFAAVLLWLAVRRRLEASWRLRLAFCFLPAASIAPTVVTIWGGNAVLPAIFVAPAAFSGGSDWQFGLFFGVLPIVLVALLIFILWTFILR